MRMLIYILYIYKEKEMEGLMQKWKPIKSQETRQFKSDF